MLSAVPMADTTLAFIFSFLRFIPTLIRQQERKQWLKHVSAEESFNKTVGIIGLGAIGEEVARKCKLLGMRTLATKKTPSKIIWVDEVYPPSRMTEILIQSDFVVVVSR
jgi:phosphoglycerate dehydrogenase-like enzyme